MRSDVSMRSEATMGPDMKNDPPRDRAEQDA
jgi:hypothetical protein